MSGTVVVTETSKREYDSSIWERVLVFSFDTGSADEVKKAIALNGILQKVIVVCGNAGAANPTATVAIDDNSNIEMFSVAGLVEGSTSVYNVSEALSGEIDIGVKPSLNPAGNDYAVTVILRGI